ncbi:MAG: transcription termination factor NusA [Bacilli bacterium]
MSDEEIKDEKNVETVPAETEAVEETVEKPKRRGRKSKNTEDANKITGAVDTNNFELAAGEIEKDSMVKANDVAEILVATMEQAYLEWSYPGLFKDKDSEDPVKELVKAHVVFDDNLTSFKIYDVKTVCEEDNIVDDSYQISVEDAQAVKPDAKVGDTVEIPFDVKNLDKSYVRRVKQLFQSKLKDASRQAILSVYSNQIGGLIEGTVTKAETGGKDGIIPTSYELTFGKASGFLKRGSLIPQDRFAVGEKVLVYLSDVSDKMNPPSLVISRSNEKFVQKLLEKAVPEIQNGEVKIKAIAREAGKRTKVLVESTNPNLDPVGACVGPESARIRTVLGELKGEKIDILKYNSNKALQIIEAMKPSTVIGLTCLDDFFDSNVHYDEIEKEPDYEFPKITAVVMNGNQGVAIGSAGVNVRLASRITMCTISVLQADDAIKQGVKYTLVPEIEKMVADENAELAKENAPVEGAATEATTEAATTAAPAAETVPAVETATTTAAPTTEPAAVEAKPVAATEVKPVEAKPAEVKPVVAPVAEAKPVVEAKPAEKVEHVEIKNKPKISLEELEEALTQKKGPAETRSYKRRWNNHDDHRDNKPAPTAPSKASTVAAMPIYTEEELKEMQDNQENSDNNNQDFDDIDLDQYDSDKYYDDGSNSK